MWRTGPGSSGPRPRDGADLDCKPLLAAKVLLLIFDTYMLSDTTIRLDRAEAHMFGPIGQRRPLALRVAFLCLAASALALTATAVPPAIAAAGCLSPADC